MAEALISGLVNDLLGRLTSAAIQEYGLLRGLKDDLLTLEDDFKLIQAVLEDAEEKQTREKAVELWLKRLRSESLKMENLLDDVSAEAMMRQLHKELGKKHRLRAFFSSDHNPLMFRTRIAHKVKAIRRRFADISAKRLELNLSPGNETSPVDGGIGGGIPNRETSSLIHSSTIFGRNEELKMVIEKICNTDIGKKEDLDIPVYAIWGMGGLGKTTLAQLVYNDERVKELFDLHCWIYVSENFQVKEILKGIRESIDTSERELSRLDGLQTRVQDMLRGKRFLVVLDDVWIENSEKDKWEDLSKTLSCGAEGSIVVMTTRSKTTSRMMAKFPELQHQLGCLSEEDSWLLFKKLAFAEGREGGDITELEPIGKEIVEKCKGLPLAVKTLGGLMWSKSSTSDWQRVMRSDIWELQEIKILPALKLSYDNLHPHVKRCFAYCCMLPKGHRMEKDLLISLWKANRLIPSRGEADWYVFGEEILNCLVWRSFFQVVNYDDKGIIINTYIMHDLMHDLARYVMGNDCWITEPGKELIVPDEVLHLSSSFPDFASLQPADLEKLKSLRSLFIFGDICTGNVNLNFNHVYLRVLYLEGIGSTLPESICKLKHLRYLNLSNSCILVLPESIINLQNLQVLLLKSCYILKLPEGMGYMRNLQYLNLSNSYIQVLPESIIYLQHLQVLLLNGCEFLYKLPDGLRYMRNLQYLNLSNSGINVLPESIIYLQNLQVLLLNGCRKLDELPEGMGNMRNLQYLDLSDLRIEVLPESISDLQNLQVLLLHGCLFLDKLPDGMGNMRNLQYLDLSDSGIEVLPESISDLQNLQVLILIGCRDLFELPDGMGHMRNLRYLDTSDCDRLRCLPVGIGKLTSLRRLTSFLIGRNGAQIGELGYLNLLGPDLRLEGLEKIKGLMEARSANLKSKTHLLNLELIWMQTYEKVPEQHDEEVLEGLEPNPRLEDLTIEGYNGENISPSWIVNLRSLDRIQFYNCYQCQHIPPLGKLPNLRVIKLKSLESLKCFHDDDMSSDNILFPHLQELEISYCSELINLPGNLPKLKELTLKYCGKLVSLPEEIQSFKDLNTLKIWGCENLSRRYAKDVGVDWPKISHITNITIFDPRYN